MSELFFPILAVLGCAAAIFYLFRLLQDSDHGG
jgi:hypothetical protein